MKALKKGSHIMSVQDFGENSNSNAMLGGIDVVTCKERIEIVRPRRGFSQRLTAWLFGKNVEPSNIFTTFDDICQVLRISKSGKTVVEIPYATINYTEMLGGDAWKRSSHDLCIKHEGGALPLVGLYSRRQGRKVLSELRQATMVPVII